MTFRANHIAGYGMADVRRTPPPPQTITYYDYTSTLKKKQGPQPRTVMIQGLFRNDLQVGIERSDTGDSIDLTIETIQKRLDEFEKAQKGEETAFHDNNGNINGAKGKKEAVAEVEALLDVAKRIILSQ